jgi:hypothetical protein
MSQRPDGSVRREFKIRDSHLEKTIIPAYKPPHKRDDINVNRSNSKQPEIPKTNTNSSKRYRLIGDQYVIVTDEE